MLILYNPLFPLLQRLDITLFIILIRKLVINHLYKIYIASQKQIYRSVDLLEYISAAMRYNKSSMYFNFLYLQQPNPRKGSKKTKQNIWHIKLLLLLLFVLLVTF